MDSRRTQQPQFSIVTPCYNSGSTIEKTIQSVLGQSITNLQHIIVDGGSTDATIPTVQRYMRRDPRLLLIQENDNSMTEALNKGFRRATGAIFSSLNADDCYLPDALEQVRMAVAGTNFKCIVGNTIIQDTSGRLLFWVRPWGVIFPASWYVMGCMTSESSIFFSRNCIDSIGHFNEKYRLSQDFELYLRIKGRFRIRYLNKYLSRFLMHDSQLSARYSHRLEEEVDNFFRPKILRKFYASSIGSLLPIAAGIRRYPQSRLLGLIRGRMRTSA